MKIPHSSPFPSKGIDRQYTLVCSVKSFQEARAKVTDEIMQAFMRPRKLEWAGNPNLIKPPPSESKPEAVADGAEAEGQKSQGKRGRARGHPRRRSD